ncbi:MAG TPA: fluoride efflux transporter CrcB [Candidatus Nanoarchaeia archaeon]|nr:fluoride efflux transporter CrcB [Candidatus Nanoarchaeia archaeon]
MGKKTSAFEVGLLGIGAIAGAFLRYRLVQNPVLVGGLQVNVLIINVIGSFVIGLFSVAALTLNLDPKYSLLVATGFCGSFTTMSSFALETSNLLGDNRFILVAVNILANVGLSLGAVLGGQALGNFVMEHALK